VMTNEDICNFISHRMKVHDNLETISNEVIDTCLYKVSLHLLPQENNIFCLPQGSRDNMSIIIIAFPACPTVVQVIKLLFSKLCFASFLLQGKIVIA
jgi:hypothetical protein